MDQMSQLNELLIQHGLEDAGAKIKASIKPSVLLRLREPGELKTPTRSRLGGLPDLASADLWPMRGTKVLEFIGQIALEKMAGLDTSELLPKDGLLSFFYDVGQMPWGHDSSERGGWRVLYTEASCPLSRVQPPKVKIFNAQILPEFEVEFQPSLTIPTMRSIELDRLQLTQAQRERYFDFRIDLQTATEGDLPQHRLLGHPDGIQGCMQRTVQFASRDLKLAPGVYDYHEHPQAAELIPGAHDWQLLLQIDSDDRLKVCWGDWGRIYFWVHREDLAKRDLSKCWVFLQCG